MDQPQSRAKRGRKRADCKFSCDTCGNTYKFYGNLNQHLRYECGIEPQFQCTYCPYRAKLKGNLKKHMLNHRNKQCW